MKITYNITGPARKELVNAIAHLLAVDSVYQGPPSFAYNIGGYVVDKNGKLNTPEEAETDDVFRLVDALYAEYEYKPEEPLSELFPDEDADTDEVDAEPEEEKPDADEAEDFDDAEEDDEAEEEAEDSDEESEPETSEEPEPDDAPETAAKAGDSPACEDDTEAPVEALENGLSAPDEGEETADDEAVESAEDTEESKASDETDNSDDTHLTLSLPREKFSPGAIERLKALVQSKQTLLKKVFETDDLSIIVTDDQIQFPWFTLHGIDGEIDAYAKFIHAIALRALTSSRISSTEKPTDNDKFTMRLFLNNLGFKGEEYKFARRFLIRNLEGNGAWRYGNAPTASDFNLDMPTVFKPTAAPSAQDVPTEETEATSDDEAEEEVGNGEEESIDEE